MSTSKKSYLLGGAGVIASAIFIDLFGKQYPATASALMTLSVIALVAGIISSGV